MFNVNEENGRLEPTGEPATGVWFPLRPLSVFNGWAQTWQPVHQVSYYGSEYHVGNVTTNNLQTLPVRYETDD